MDKMIEVSEIGEQQSVLKEANRVVLLEIK
jgi:hypothetical protein